MKVSVGEREPLNTGQIISASEDVWRSTNAVNASTAWVGCSADNACLLHLQSVRHWPEAPDWLVACNGPWHRWSDKTNGVEHWNNHFQGYHNRLPRFPISGMSGSPFLACHRVALGAGFQRTEITKLAASEMLCTNFSCKQALIYNNTAGNSSGYGHIEKVVMSGRDASWVLTSAVIIFTMQTGEI